MGRRTSQGPLPQKKKGDGYRKEKKLGEKVPTLKTREQNNWGGERLPSKKILQGKA